MNEITQEEKDRFVDLMKRVVEAGSTPAKNVAPAALPITSDVPVTVEEESPERKEFFEEIRMENEQIRQDSRPLTIEDIETITGSTIKRDDTNKVITLLCMALNYTDHDQTNIGFLAEASSGKSYIPLELANYFPAQDVMKVGYASPTSFFHDLGEWVPDPRDKRDVEDEKKAKIIKIDLSQKILLFMDQPHDQLLQRLRSLLSHDDREVTYKIADRTQRSGLRTKTVIIRGFPTVIFCSAKFNMEDQEKTRLLLLSPQIDQEKIREAIMLKIDKEGDTDAYNLRLVTDPRRLMLVERISSIKSARIKEIKIPEELRQEIYEHFTSSHRYAIPRHQRDISRLLCVIKGFALLNFMHRQRVKDCIYINREDMITGFKLYTSVSEANELGLSPELFNIYESLSPSIKLEVGGVDRKEFQKLYYESFHKILGRKSADVILTAFETAGLLVSQQDQLDKRVTKYIPPDMGYTPKHIEAYQKEVTPPEGTHNLGDY